jgi:hypothetical protein
LGQGWVFGGQYPGGPMSLTAGGRGQVEGERKVKDPRLKALFPP